METNPDHRLWPGKARPLPDSAASWHPATFHCLDVAACAEALLEASPAWKRRLARAAGVSPEVLRTVFVQLIALHDIGKLSEKFCTDIGGSLPLDPGSNVPSSLRHWEISAELLIRELDGEVAELVGMPDRRARKALYAAVAGHHGRPPATPASFDDTLGVPACKAFLRELADLDGLRPVRADIDRPTAQRLSWSLAGLAVASDWIGSDQHRFPYTSPKESMAEYWAITRERARTAVEAAGMRGAEKSSLSGVTALFDIETPRPMQSAVEDVTIPEQPTLFVLEDITGSGKTEAAIALVQRLMAKGLAEGVYIALPTMATANAMYARLGSFYRRLFTPRSDPSIALAHGKRLQNDGYLNALALGETVGAVAPSAGDDAAERLDERSVGAVCGAWIADDRRKAFLAEVGVGTIDQAFLAVLPVKFSTLRLFGLSRRVLVVDEAHACDPYMQKVLERSLEMQAAMRGSAIVMTATLTRASRQALVDAFRRGLGAKNDVNLPDHYPSLTVATDNTGSCDRHKVGTVASLRRIVPVRRLSTTSEAVELLCRSAAAGACGVWIRNTVDSAIDAAATLRAAGVDVELFHARFAMHDRLCIERRVVERFGKSGSEGQRRGRILVATQVVEQSLDLDFDVMVSDIAPIDSLIQRLGRLWRHVFLDSARDRHGAEQVLHVLSPDPDDADMTAWSSGEVAGSVAIYGAPLLWRTARVLADTPEIASPDNLRDLLERVAGEAAMPIPEGLEAQERKLEGESFAERALARDNLVSVAGGYAAAKGLTDSERYPTRSGAASVRLVLARREFDGLRFWAPGDDSGDASEVGISAYRHEKLGTPAPDDARRISRLQEGWPEWKRTACPVLIVEPDGKIGENARYDAELGLTFKT